MLAKARAHIVHTASTVGNGNPPAAATGAPAPRFAVLVVPLAGLLLWGAGLLGFRRCDIT